MQQHIDITNLEQAVGQYCQVNHISGILRITVGGTIVWQKSVGYADVSNLTPFTDDSRFALYSLSKPFCAIGLLMLKDQGLVDLDAHPAKYVPEAAGFDSRVTIRHMLHHTSGLPDFWQNADFRNQHLPGHPRLAREHLKLLTAYPSYFAPGTDTRYANINYLLCALMIENVSMTDYASYMRKEVFEPLGMLTAVVEYEETDLPNRVNGYELLNGNLIAVPQNRDWMLGAGDIVATLDDVYHLNEAIKYRYLLQEKTWEEVLTPTPLGKMGMGCSITGWHGKNRITHNGGHTGFRTLHVQLPEDDFDLIFLSNSGFGNARKDLAEMVHAAFYGHDNIMDEALEMDKGYAV